MIEDADVNQKTTELWKTLYRFISGNAPWRVCRACLYCVDGSTCINPEVGGSDVAPRMLTTANVEDYTDCLKFTDSFETRCRVFVGQTRREPTADWNKPEAYSLVFDYGDFTEITRVADAESDIGRGLAGLKFSQLTTTRDKNEVTIKESTLSHMILNDDDLPIPDDMPLTVFIVRDYSKRNLQLGMSGSWFSEEGLKDHIAWLFYKEADRLLYKADFAGALYTFDQALAVKPDYAKALAGKGTALQMTGREEEAVKLFEETLKHNSFIADAWMGLAGMRAKGADPKTLYSFFDEGFAKHPNDAGWLFGKGCWAYSIGDGEMAIDCYARVVESEPGCQDAVDMLGLAERKYSYTDARDPGHGAEFYTPAKDGKARSGRYYHVKPHLNEDEGVVLGIRWAEVAERNQDFPKDVKHVRIWTDDGLDETIPLTEDFWVKKPVFDHPAIAEWLEKNELVNVPQHLTRNVALCSDAPGSYELFWY